MIIFYFLIFVMPLTQHHIWGRFIGEVTGIKYLGLACLPYALIHLALRRRFPAFLETWQARFFLLLYVIATFSQFTQGRAPWWGGHWMSYTSFVVLFFVTLVVVDSVERLRWVGLSAIGSLGLASLYVLRDWQSTHILYPNYRPGWVVGDPNYFTVSVLLFTPLAVALLRTNPQRWEKLFCLGNLVLIMLAVMVSASRGGFLGLIAASLFLLSKLGQRIRNFLVLGIALSLFTLFTPISPLERFLHPSSGDQDAAQVRVALWHGGLRMMETHPLIGVGLDGFKWESPRYVNPDELPKYEISKRVAHNSYVEIGSEMGIPALLGFLCILFFTLVSLGQTRRQAERLGTTFVGHMALGLQAGVIGAAVAIFFVSGQYQKMFWLAVFVSVCLPSLVAPGQRKDKRGSLTRSAARMRDNGPPRGVPRDQSVAEEVRNAKRPASFQ